MDEFQVLAQAAPAALADLRCEYQVNPLGIGVPNPRLSWKMVSGRRGARQAAYRILAAGSPAGLFDGSPLLWDTGRVESDQSIQIRYQGLELSSRQQVWWIVQVWDETGQMLSSEPAWWEMGLLKREDWTAEWVGAPLEGGKHASIPAAYMRRSFELQGQVQKARLYVTALGLYEISINGKRATEDVFTPGWTDYHTRVQYQVYDVTGLLRDGENVLGSILGDGWYCGHVGWVGRQVYGDRPKLLAQLEVTGADGTVTTVASNRGCMAAFGPILQSDFLMGESYDARRELTGWDRPGYTGENWLPVVVFPDPGIQRTARRGPAVRRVMEIPPVSDPRPVGGWPSSKWIFDLGQNMVGWVRLKVRGPAGTTITLRFAEVLNPDGTLYTTNLRSARSTDDYTLKGEGEEVYEPHFTFHGFRYVEVTGYPGQPDRSAITGIVLHSDMEIAGDFECSDPLINQLQHNIQWGQRGNFVDVPTDCPQRDERLGWTGDAQVFIRTAAFNMDVAPFFTKWVQDLADAQSALGQIPSVAPNILGPSGADGGPAWADAFVICPWTVYLTSGDREMLERYFPAVCRFVDHLEQASVRLIRCHPDSAFENGDWPGYGDWLSINAETPKDLIGTAFLAGDARIVAKMAALLGRTEECARYEKLAEDARAAFLRRFVTADGLVAAQTQTAYVLALYFDLLPAELRPNAITELVRDIECRGNHLSTGFVGAPYLMHVLTRAGRSDVAYTLLNQKSWPSWLYPVTQGATTIWERWDGWTHDRGFQDPGMNSFNHYAYGSIGDWLYRTVAGIDLDASQPGYRHIFLCPHPGGGLEFARAFHETPYGKVSSGWKFEGDRFTWEVTVPPNTRAELAFPVSSLADVEENGSPIDQAQGIRVEAGSLDRSCSAAPGTYIFTMPAEKVHRA